MHLVSDWQRGTVPTLSFDRFARKDAEIEQAFVRDLSENHAISAL